MFKRVPFLLLLSVLAACSSGTVQETLGLTREGPDEFSVVSRPPLTVPKEFYLVPPTEGDAGEFGRNADHAARSVLTGQAGSMSDGTLEEASRGLADTAAPVVQTRELETPGESALLQQSGAAIADPTIRQKLWSPGEQEDPGLLQKLRGDPSAEPLVDAKKEQARLQQNKQAGKTVDAGKVAVTDPKKKGVLQRLFE